MHSVVDTLLFQLLVKHNSAALPCKRFVNKRLFIIATPHPNRKLHNYKMFSLFNTRAKTNHIDSARFTPLSMNKFTTEYWNS